LARPKRSRHWAFIGQRCRLALGASRAKPAQAGSMGGVIWKRQGCHLIDPSSHIPTLRSFYDCCLSLSLSLTMKLMHSATALQLLLWTLLTASPVTGLPSLVHHPPETRAHRSSRRSIVDRCSAPTSRRHKTTTRGGPPPEASPVRLVHRRVPSTRIQPSAAAAQPPPVSPAAAILSHDNNQNNNDESLRRLALQTHLLRL
jgi:hypothetical protein